MGLSGDGGAHLVRTRQGVTGGLHAEAGASASYVKIATVEPHEAHRHREPAAQREGAAHRRRAVTFQIVAPMSATTPVQIT